MGQQYWVVGGIYRDTRFDEIEEGPHAFGPFPSYDAANQVWRERSMESRSTCCARYAIVVSAPNPGQHRLAPAA